MTNTVFMKKISAHDEEALVIYQTLQSSFQEVARCYGIIGNVFGLFLHDLLAHFSGILFFRERASASNFETRFPYASLEYARAPFVVHQDAYISYTPTGSRLARNLRAARILPVAIGSGISWGYYNDAISGRLLSLLATQPKFTTCYLPNQREQVDALIDCVRGICSQYSIANGEIVEKNWRDYCDLHTTSVQISNREKGAIVGSRMNHENRKIAINFLQQGKPVVGYTHGEICNQIMNEPAIGYAELGYCSVLVDYGDYEDVGDGTYNKPIVKPTKTIRRESRSIRKAYRPDVAIKMTARKTENWLYVPTGYNECLYYGPFRGYSDEAYRTWQRALMEGCPNLTIKVHPKSESFNEGKIETRRLEQCVQDYDVLIFDYYSTAMTVGIFTDKPVLYFDIGLRCMSEQFREDLQKRVFVYEIDARVSFVDQIRQAIEQFTQDAVEYTNIHLEKYSFVRERKHEVWNPLRQIF
jgi:hypothetical protein